MCGICGSTRDDAPTAVARMNAAMRHRGPDDEGLMSDDDARVAVGARRLSIIDVEGGHQPVANEDATVWAALNGEIYNYGSLRAQLERRGHRFHSSVDTEVLVHLYEEFGDELVHALEGMYAFAIWDRREQRLLLARDRFGEKPLFYAEHGSEIVFASELDAVLAGTGARAEPDPAAVDEFFLFGYVAAPATILRGVSQLPPATSLTWTRQTGASAPRPYWRLPCPLDGLLEPEPAVAEQVRELLFAAVRSRMMADVPLGVFLSGGVDSTLIAAIAAQESTGPVRTFTVGYDTGADETLPARRVAALLGSEHHEYRLTQDEIGSLVPDLLSRLDQPIADRALVAMFALARFARGHVKTVIGGEGADELFGGYRRYRWLSRAGRVPAVVSRIAGPPLEGPLRRLPHRYGDHIADLIAPQAPQLLDISWATERRLSGRGVLYGPALRMEDPDRWRAVWWNGSLPVVSAAMAHDSRRWLPDDVLAKADRAGMLASLEVRTPYLHRELAELAALIPPSTHMKRGGKALLRNVLDELVPPAARRRKAGFQVPAAGWLRGPLAPAVEAQLGGGAAYADGWLSRPHVARLWGEHRTGRRDHTALLWPALAFGLWLDQIQARPAAPAISPAVEISGAPARLVTR